MFHLLLCVRNVSDMGTLLTFTKQKKRCGRHGGEHTYADWYVMRKQAAEIQLIRKTREFHMQKH